MLKKLAPKNAKDVAIYLGLFVGGYVVWKGYIVGKNVVAAGKQTGEGFNKVGQAVKEAVTEDLNPASNKNIVYKTAEKVSGDGGFRLLDPVFDLFHGNKLKKSEKEVKDSDQELIEKYDSFPNQFLPITDTADTAIRVATQTTKLGA